MRRSCLAGFQAPPDNATVGYTGADVREVVLMGLKLAFHAGVELTTERLLAAVPEVRPLSQTDPERVAAMTEWLDRHAKAASARRSTGSEHADGSRQGKQVSV